MEQRSLALSITEGNREWETGFRKFLENIPGMQGAEPEFRQGIEVEDNAVVLTCPHPKPSDGGISEKALVLEFVQSGTADGAEAVPVYPAFCQK